mgnify:CR=1 FL=1
MRWEGRCREKSEDALRRWERFSPISAPFIFLAAGFNLRLAQKNRVD